MSRLKLLTLTTSYPVRRDSTSGVFVKRLLDCLADFCDIRILAPADDRKISMNDNLLTRFSYAPTSWQILAHKPGGIPVAIKNNKGLIFLLPVFLLSFVFNALRMARNADVVFANWSVSGFVGAICKVLLRKPLVTCFRGDDVAERLGLIKSFFLNISLRYSDYVVVVSEDMNELLAAKYSDFSEKILLIKNGVDKRFFENRQKQKSDVIKIAFVGSLIGRKNVAYVISECSRIIKAGKKVVLSVVGDGPEMKTLKTLAQGLDIGHAVNFLGRQDGEGVRSALMEARYFISASLHEGRPNSVIEAVCAGCIPILSDINGHREIAKNFPRRILFNPSAHGDLCDLLCSIENDDACIADLELASKRFVLENLYSWEECASKYFNLFASIIREARG